MKYFCVSISKEIGEVQSFSLREEAVDYFETVFGQAVYEKRRRRRERLEKDILKYKEEINQQILSMDRWNQEGTIVNEDYVTLDMLLKRWERKEDTLEELMSYFDEKPISFEEKLDSYKKNPVIGEKQLLLRMGSIYENKDKFEVVGENYYYTVHEIECEKNLKDAFRELPEAEDGNGFFRLLLPVEKGMQRVSERIAKQRQGILREFHGNKKRLRNQKLE